MSYENPRSTPHPQAEMYATTFQEQYQHIVGWLVQSMHDRDMAEDVVQDTFVHALTHNRHNPDKELASYRIHVIAQRKGVDEQQKIEADRAGDSAYDRLQPRVENDTPETIYVDKEPDEEQQARAEMLRRAIRRLAPLQREAIQLELRGYNPSIIARRLNVPIHTAKNHVQEGKLRLVQILAPTRDTSTP